MKIEVSVDKKWAVGIIASLILLAGVIFVIAYDEPIPNPGHGGDTIWVDINDVEMTLQQALDTTSIPSAVLCFDDVGNPGEPCYEASTNVGVGTTEYRAINCINRNGKINGKGIRYFNSQWQYPTEGGWAHCDDGTALVVRIGQ